MLCSECQPECENDIHVPMDILQLKERLKKKKRLFVSQREKLCELEIFKNHRDSRKKMFTTSLYIKYTMLLEVYGDQ